MKENFSFCEYYPQLISADRELIKTFLASHELGYENDIEYACGFEDTDGKLVACGCCAGNILKGFAIEMELRGNNLMGRMISKLISNRFQKGISHIFVFTKTENLPLFTASGFYTLAVTPTAVMLENKASGIEHYLRPLKTNTNNNENAGTIVMNCNPFTLGHRYLIEYAARQCDVLYIFVVEEDRSVFPFEVRFFLVKKGVSDLPNVQVYPSGPYIISNQTFPTYFLKQDTDVAAVQAELDLTLFAERIANPLNIRTRFVGEEPICAVTQRYNQVMKQILPRYGVCVKEIPRKMGSDGCVISASLVRSKLAQMPPGEWLKLYVPEVTYAYLCSPDAEIAVKKCIEA
ncbi:MAG: [citrate (pro-3S)-lyase] ligase [Clostridiaceae bacterium]|nr:[citrate (pro-3S)-lyase] ligase [Clostridiaceae bacterium]